mmetsp:Transcript_42576/g.134060  ORF Transcript_42576/g.134060 Transcript_42576/m.134060 type:complete len:129 (+) Transcript_42576:352-738(+)
MLTYERSTSCKFRYRQQCSLRLKARVFDLLLQAAQPQLRVPFLRASYCSSIDKIFRFPRGALLPCVFVPESDDAVLKVEDGDRPTKLLPYSTLSGGASGGDHLLLYTRISFGFKGDVEVNAGRREAIL